MKLLLGIVILEAVFLAAAIYIIITTQKNINLLSKNAAQVAKKGIEVEDINLRGFGNINELASSLNLIKENMLEFVDATKGNVIVLTDAIEALSKSVEANTSGNAQTSDSLVVVAEKTSEQLSLVKENMDLIASNNTELTIIDKNITNIRNSLSESVNICKNGIQSLENYEQELESISSNLENSTNIVTEFDMQIEQINALTEMVVNISEELKLLSLNASIESARAGEAGKGFSVVASEMNKLSEQTGSNMDTVYEILSKIIESSSKLRESITYCNSVFQQSAHIFTSVSDSFRYIYRQSEEINHDMINMSKKYSIISDNSDLSRDKAESVLDASQVISNSTSDIVAISEETTAEAALISDNVSSLKNLLGSIQSLITKFNTGVTPTKNNRANKVKIAYFSKLDNYFWYSIKRGVNYAQKELADNNVEIIYYPYVTSEDEAHFSQDVDTCIANGVDAIIYPGFIENSYQPIKKASNAGIKIFTYNCDCDSSINRVSCYAPDQREAAEIAAAQISKLIGGAGNVAVIYGDKTQDVNVQRYEGFVNCIKSKYKAINIVDTVNVDHTDETMYKKTLECIKNHPDIKAIYSTAGMQISLAKAIVDSGKAGQIKAVIFDKNADIAKYISSGVIGAAIDHDPFSQGHDPIILMYNHIVDGYNLPKEGVNCKVTIFNEENINDHLDV